MTWAQTWNDILNGGSPRWKVTDLASKETALQHIETYTQNNRKLAILCPLAGDDMFVHYAWSKGHSVTAIDLVPAAVAAMRAQFDSDSWACQEREDGMVEWTHTSGRATLLQGDVFTDMKDLKSKFDVVYDKDSFGALDKSMRFKFCERLSQYVKEGGIVYTEVKFRPEGPGRLLGPPFHVEKKDLMEPANFGTMFEYVASLGEVYKLHMSGIQQMGHILRRLPK